MSSHKDVLSYDSCPDPLWLTQDSPVCIAIALNFVDAQQQAIQQTNRHAMGTQNLGALSGVTSWLAVRTT